MTTDRPNVSHGDRDIALANEILRTTVGSGVHGLAIEGHDDNDETGVYIETQAQVLGLAPSSESYSSRTQPEGVRSGPGDTDLVIYAFRKFLRLVVQGNPSILVPLYVPEEFVLFATPLGEALRNATPVLVSQNTGRRHLGYLDGQRERMIGGGHQARVPKRPELIERYGYDTKYASHALRLGLQGIELVTEGYLTLPMHTDDLRRAMDVKLGKMPFAEALAEIDEVRAELASLLNSGVSALPKEPDMKFVNPWMAQIQKSHWSALSRRVVNSFSFILSLMSTNNGMPRPRIIGLTNSQ